jgi:hypothetical protein
VRFRELIKLTNYLEGGWAIYKNQITKSTCSCFFWESFLLENSEVLQDIRNEFPYEHLVFGSTSGEISGSSVNDDSVL